MDLRTRYPRSVRDRVGGYVHLGRMIDKCRALLAKTEGEYIYPCPMDERLLEFAGLTEARFTDAVQNGSDAEVVQWFLAQATSHPQEEIDAWNDTMLSVGPDTEEKWSYFKGIRDAIDPTRIDITSWADLLDLDERRAIPLRQRDQSSLEP